VLVLNERINAKLARKDRPMRTTVYSNGNFVFKHNWAAEFDRGRIRFITPKGEQALRRFTGSGDTAYTDRLLVEKAYRSTWSPALLAGLIPQIEPLAEKYPAHGDDLRAGIEYLKHELETKTSAQTEA